MFPSSNEQEGGRPPAFDDATQADPGAPWMDMRRRWRTGQRVAAEAYLSGPRAVREESQTVEIYGEFCLREELGEEPSLEEYERRFPRFATAIRRQITVHRALSETGVLHATTAPPVSDSQAETLLPPYIPLLASKVSSKIGVLHDEAPMPSAIGKYRLVQKLGAGGQAWVYRAVHPTLGRDVVIKLSRLEIDADWNGLDRLLDEGRVLAELDHPHLARIYDLDVYDRRLYLVLEYVPGKSLDQYAADTPPTFHQAAAMVLKIAQAVAAAHHRGVTHCDIKPRNVVIDEQGEPRLLDFGLSRWENAWSSSPDPGPVIAGTPQFMAPEQTQGQSAAIGPRTDVFALGGLLYYLLSGHPPFSGHDVQTVLHAAAQCDFDRTILERKRVPQGLEAICLRAMALRPEDRYASADDLAGDLQRFVERRPRKRLVATAALSLAALALGITLWTGTHAFLRRASPRVGAAAAVSTPVPAVSPLLAVQVFRDKRYIDITDAAPLKTGDKLRVRLTLPSGSFVSLFLINGRGEVRDLMVSSSRSSVQEITYPPTPGKAVPLTGPAGSEVLLACAARDRPVTHEALLSLLGPQTPWPSLPAAAILKLENDKVVVAQAGRDFGGPVDAPDPEGEALGRLQRLGQQLSRYETRLGVVFRHLD